jgi:hypothetical protein
MFTSTRLRGIDKVPRYDSNKYIPLFFIIFMIIGNFVISNLFVGVIISSYNREKENIGKHFLLTSSQKEWLKTKLLILEAKPKFYIKRPDFKLR